MRTLVPVVTVFFLLFLNEAVSAELIRPVVGANEDYQVKEEGEDLLLLAEKFSLAIEHLAFANGLPEYATRVAAGTTLTIPKARILPSDPPRTGLVLNIPERGIYRFRDGTYQGFTPVSVGSPPQARTPIGEFRVIEKIKDPTWVPPAWADSRAPVGPGADNPLGNRWIGLSAHMVGIHGTNDPLNVGAPVTHGCIRCYPDQILRLFEEVSVGMPIRIEYETAKLGRTESGEVVLATFPDIYNLSPPEESSRKLLSKAGYGSVLSSKNFLAKLKMDLGVTLSLDKAKKDALAKPSLEEESRITGEPDR